MISIGGAILQLFVAEVFFGDEVVLDVVFDGFGEGGDFFFVAGFLEFGDVGLGVVLVFVADGFGHVDEVDLGRFVHGGEDGVGEVEPGVGFAGAEVEEAGGVLFGGEVEGHLDGVFDVEEVSFLFAIFVVGTVAAEEFESVAFFDLVVGFVDEAPHVILVVFVGAEDVEVFQAGYGIEPAFFLCPGVEHVLGVSVHVEGAKFVEVGFLVIHALGAISVGGGGGCVDEACLGVEGVLGEFVSKGEVVFYQIGGVGFGGTGAGTEVEDEAVGVFVGAFDAGQKFVGFEVVVELQGHEVLPFFTCAQNVRDVDVGVAVLVEGLNEGTSYEACSAGNEDSSSEGVHNFRGLLRKFYAAVPGSVGSVGNDLCQVITLEGFQGSLGGASWRGDGVAELGRGLLGLFEEFGGADKGLGGQELGLFRA